MKLIDGLSLYPLYSPHTGHAEAHAYRLGTPERGIEISSPSERSALLALRNGHDPYSVVAESDYSKIDSLVAALTRINFLIVQESPLLIPRRYLDHVTERDVAANQIRERAKPELVPLQWSGNAHDRGVTALGKRAQAHIELSGRSRVLTLVHSILIASGVLRISFSDKDRERAVNFTDIGISTIRASDLGSNYYALQESWRRDNALFPTSRKGTREVGDQRPTLTIHDGPVDADLLADWMSSKQPHLLIHRPNGNQIAIGPLVIPTTTPCLRCLHLYELEHYNSSIMDCDPLTEVRELPMHMAHTIAGAISAAALSYIDHLTDPIEKLSDMCVGEKITYQFLHSTQPHRVTISRHPLCGCRDLL